MDENEDGKISNPFDEVPSWYDVEPLSTDELNPELVPPQRTRLGETAGTGYVPTRDTGMDAGKMAGRIWIGIFFFVAVATGLVGLLFGVISNGLFGGRDVVVGECAGLVEADNVVRLAARGISCDDTADIASFGDLELRVTEIVDLSLAQMPGRTAEFWEDMRTRCEAASEEIGVKFAWPLAATDAEWEAGNRSVVCVNAWADELAEAEQDVRQAAESTGMEIDEVMEFIFGEAIGNWGAL